MDECRAPRRCARAQHREPSSRRRARPPANGAAKADHTTAFGGGVAQSSTVLAMEPATTALRSNLAPDAHLEAVRRTNANLKDSARFQGRKRGHLHLCFRCNSALADESLQPGGETESGWPVSWS